MDECDRKELFEQAIKLLEKNIPAFGLLDYQPYFEWLHRYSLAGMNYGPGVDKVQTSGERQIIRCLAEQFPESSSPIVFDVGANRGDYAREVLEAFGPDVMLYCFEPSIGPFRALEAAFRDHENVYLLNMGLGKEDRTVSMHGFQPSEGISAIAESIRGQVPNYTQEVELQSIDSFCQRNGVPRIDLLKLDVEGYELNVLQGAKNMIDAGAIPYIQFEFGHTDIYMKLFFRDFFNLLTPRYVLYRILKDGAFRLTAYRELSEIFGNANFLAIASDRAL